MKVNTIYLFVYFVIAITTTGMAAYKAFKLSSIMGKCKVKKIVFHVNEKKVVSLGEWELFTISIIFTSLSIKILILLIAI